MSLSISQLLLITLAYLSLLFLAAWLTDKGRIPKGIVQHPLTYILSLGVYSGVWAIYGAAGNAQDDGLVYLGIYLGISGAFFLAPFFLNPILQITRNYQLGSLADLFAFRFRSAWAGTLTTIVALLSTLPLIAMQIQAVSDVLQIIGQESAPSHMAIGFCIIVTVFAILFGARHLSTRENHLGLVVAMALGSLIKLLAFAALALFAVYGVFGGFGGLEQWLIANPEQLEPFQRSIDADHWRITLLLCFAAAITMPHMFHMTFTENLSPRSLTTASWGFPLLLLLFSICIPLIIWGNSYLDTADTWEYLAVNLGMELSLQNQSALFSIFSYLCGLSAASALIIVTTLALSSMALNHLILPVYQPAASENIYNWLIWMRRLLIALIMLTAYGLYTLLESHHSLANLITVAFVGSLQLLPGVLATLYAPKANRKGFIAGLSCGALVWAIALGIPLVTGLSSIDLPLTSFDIMADKDLWYTTAVWSLSINVAVFLLVSWLGKTSKEEKVAASACAVNAIENNQLQELSVSSIEEFQQQLSKPLGSHVAQREIKLGLSDLELSPEEKRPFALRRLREQIQVNLSGIMGPAVAREIVDTFLPYKESFEDYVTEDIHVIESKIEDYRTKMTGLSAELDSLRRYHRATLESIPLAACSLSKELDILMWNRAMEAVTHITARSIIGAKLRDLPEPWGELLEEFVHGSSPNMHKYSFEINHQPRWLSLHKAGIQDSNGVVVLLEDYSEHQQLENKLAHNERLASVGRLAAGVAHEIGNPITGIACLAQELIEDLDDEDHREASVQILGQTKRVSRIVQSLVNFSHSGRDLHSDNNIAAVRVNNIASEAIDLLSLNRSEQGISYVNKIDHHAQVDGDEQRLLQVFINLLSNARDASPNLGIIRLSSRIEDGSVIIDIEDQGCGIPEAIQGKLFEPFVTTKDPGKGTGLGLALVYNIIDEHFGRISFDSPLDLSNNTGTRVTIKLPMHESAPKPALESE